MAADKKYYIPTEFVTIRELAEKTLLDNNMNFKPGQRARQFRVTTVKALETAMAMKSSRDKNGIYFYESTSENVPELDTEFINDFNKLTDEEKLSLKIIVKKLASVVSKKDDILNKVIGSKSD